MKIHVENSYTTKLSELKSECSACCGLCCTALFFSKVDGFPQNKPAGKPCMYLEESFKCKIHHELAKRNMKGCIGYDCFGSGQYVTQAVFRGADWRTAPDRANELFETFIKVFRLFQVRYYLTEAMTLSFAESLWEDIAIRIKEINELCRLTPGEICRSDVESYRDRANILLKNVCACVEKQFPERDKRIPAELFGRSFRSRNMSGQNLSMKLLIASDFTGCCFAGANFLGADTRDADFSSADLSECVFLTQAQVNSAKGNRKTLLPQHLANPVTWR